ncbi:hypothetical protein BJ322DRAFT_1091545 [Thelephora terrestris]|uniref:F-box domain-containing protein n=1 Tax=Thelephora terrestris TaxID=56493 RepID=A0A9P6L1Y0_9AGAM|nr:hypothetical protein BJ322DRAFT_1091545 [Thelephora terrestris]
MMDSQTRECLAGPVAGVRTPIGDPPSAIFRLPPELLGDIFLQNVLQLPAQRGRYYGLFNFLFVCWRWYSVARGSPHLWCHLGNNIHHWPVFVALSKEVDLFVHMYDIYGEYRAPPDDRLDAMFRDRDFYSRLREFTLDGEVDVLSYIFPDDNPRPFRLVSLSIERCATPLNLPRLGFPIPKRLVEASFSSLKRLCISACIIDFDQVQIVRQLTHLSLTNLNLPYFEKPVSMKKLLYLLQANPDLQELFIDQEKCGLGVGDDEDLPFVSFARLRKLCVMLRIEDIAYFFRHLMVTSEVEEIAVETSDEDPLPEILSRWFNDVVSPRSVQSIEARPALSLFRPRMEYIRGSDGIQYPNLPCYSLLRLQMWPDQLPPFLTLGILRNATKLELFHDYLSAYSYLEIFKTASALQELVTWAGRECNSLRALLPTSQESREDVGGISYVPLPKLSYIRIIEADVEGIQDDDGTPNKAAILNVFRRRKLLGLGLRRLELVCCKCVSPGWIDELRSFVPEVLWDGVGGACLEDSDEDYCPSESSGSESDGSSWETYESGSGDHGRELDVSDEEDTATSESSDWILTPFLSGAAS